MRSKNIIKCLMAGICLVSSFQSALAAIVDVNAVLLSPQQVQLINQKLLFAKHTLNYRWRISSPQTLTHYDIGRFKDCHGNEYRVLFNTANLEPYDVLDEPYDVLETLYQRLPIVESNMRNISAAQASYNQYSTDAVVVPAKLFTKGLMLNTAEVYTYREITTPAIKRWTTLYPEIDKIYGAQRLIFLETPQNIL